jgi:hypothetical protein
MQALHLFLLQFGFRCLAAESGPDLLRGHLDVLARREVHVAGRKDGDENEHPEAAENRRGPGFRDRSPGTGFAAEQCESHDSEADGCDEAVNGEVRHEAENDGEPNQLSPSRGMILAAHVAENGAQHAIAGAPPGDTLHRLGTGARAPARGRAPATPLGWCGGQRCLGGIGS